MRTRTLKTFLSFTTKVILRRTRRFRNFVPLCLPTRCEHFTIPSPLFVVYLIINLFHKAVSRLSTSY